MAKKDTSRKARPVVWVDIKKVKLNENNPRFIRDKKFRLLVESIKTRPSGMKKRPLILDINDVIQGGNMRYRACMELKWPKVPIDVYTLEDYQEDLEAKRKDAKERGVEYVDQSYHELCREYVIIDNASFGEFDQDELANEFTIEQLEEFGLDYYDSKDIDLEDFFEEKEEKKETDHTGKIILEYNEEDHEKVIQRFSDMPGTKEEIVWELLGLNAKE